MDGAKPAFFKNRSHSRFKKKGSNKKSNRSSFGHGQNTGTNRSSFGHGQNAGTNRSSFGHGQNSGIPNTFDTVYRILCHSRKIGCVIGHGGSIINALRDETGAKIKVADAVHGTDERVIIIFSSPTRKPRNSNSNEEPEEDVLPEKEREVMQPYCPAQDALLKVHERMAAEDELYGDTTTEDNNEQIVVTARLLVPKNQIGCLLGKGGNIIEKLRTDTGANIRILAGEHVPPCAMSTDDELVQISGPSAVAKRALYEVSTMLHQNPRKENLPPKYPSYPGGQGFHPPAAPMTNPLPPGNPLWAHQNSGPRGAQPMPWAGGYGNQSSGFVPGGDASDEFFMKILCSDEKIGGVIGRGGTIVRQLQNDTGASIQVNDRMPEANERTIVVSAFEALWNPRSPTIEAILQLQNKTGEISEKGITTRLLVPSRLVGCLLGQGGHVITEMRRRTQADIRVSSKDDKPKSASADEELVQISGNFNVARDALSEIASRLRVRSLRDAKGAVEPPPVGPFHGVGPSGSIPGRRLPPPDMVGPGGFGGFEHVQGGGREFEPQNYPIHPTAPGYSNVNSSSGSVFGTGGSNISNIHEGGGREFEPQSYPVHPTATGYSNVNSSSGSVFGMGGSNISNIHEVSGARVKLQDPQAGGSECIVEIRGSSEQMNATQNLLQSFMASSVQNFNAQQQGNYQYY